MMEIVFHFQGDEVYRFELPANTTKITFKIVTDTVCQDDPFPKPVITEIEFQPTT